MIRKCPKYLLSNSSIIPQKWPQRSIFPMQFMQIAMLNFCLWWASINLAPAIIKSLKFWRISHTYVPLPLFTAIQHFGFKWQNFEKPICKCVLFKDSMCSSFELHNSCLLCLCCLTQSILTEKDSFFPENILRVQINSPWNAICDSFW